MYPYAYHLVHICCVKMSPLFYKCFMYLLMVSVTSTIARAVPTSNSYAAANL